MARGKEAGQAERRRAAQAVTDEVEAYKHANRRLQADADRLTSELAQARRSYADDTRRLRAERDNSLGPEVFALREECERLRQQKEEASARQRRFQAHWDRMFERIHEHYMREHKLTGHEAMEQIMWLLRGLPGVDGTERHDDDWVVPPVMLRGPSGEIAGGRDEAVALQRAAGMRHARTPELDRTDDDVASGPS
jgi:hypothetical protein